MFIFFDEPKTHPNYKSKCEFYNMTRKCAVLPTAIKAAFFLLNLTLY